MIKIKIKNFNISVQREQYKKRRLPPYLLSGLALPQISYGEVCAYGAHTPTDIWFTLFLYLRC